MLPFIDQPSLDSSDPRLWAIIHPGLLQRGLMCSPGACCVLPPTWVAAMTSSPSPYTQIRYLIQGEVCSPTSPLG